MLPCTTMVTQPTNPVPSDSCCLIHGSPQNQPPCKKRFHLWNPLSFFRFSMSCKFRFGSFPPKQRDICSLRLVMCSVLPSFASLKDVILYRFIPVLATKNRRFSKAQGAATGLIPEIVSSKGVERKQNSDAHKSHSIHRTGLFTLEFPIKINHIMCR